MGCNYSQLNGTNINAKPATSSKNLGHPLYMEVYSWENMDINGGFSGKPCEGSHKWGTLKWMIYNGKYHLEVDDDWGYPISANVHV